MMSTDRGHLSAWLKGYGARVQDSVFECDLTTAQLDTIGRALRRIIDPQTDSVRCYRLDAEAVGRIQILGIGQVTPTPRYYLIGPLGEPAP